MPKLKILALISIPALCLFQYMIWFYAPVEATMGLVQKIFYLHLPLAMWAFVSFLVVFAASAGYLVRPRPALDALAGAAAEIGVVFSALVLITGSIWGRAAWNVWWTWDPRLTTTLVMWFVYAGYLLLRASPLGGERRAQVCAVLGVVAFLDVPLVFLSARLWRSVHPAVFGSQGGGLEPEMRHTVVAGIVAVGLFWLCLVLARYGQARAAARLDALRARSLENEPIQG
ncbi:cytochrome c biogenesis protein [Desulfovibrio aminophilus]|nr:cytochrome c biogenesis protein CcsA [Desulfovibrio aminophilus]MCM0756741.1 cytochrome c biogenesis protein [Desulfovibrio aminophilus]